MNLINSLNMLKKKINTNNKINKIVKYMQISHMHAYTIGKEIIYIYSILYNLYKENNGKYDVNTKFYDFLINTKKFNNMYLYNLLSNNILFSEFFSKLNIKIFKLQNQYIWYYLRGYYVNDLNFLIFHINKFNNSYCVLYDYHIHYITFLYESMKSIYINNIDINLELNNAYDLYSVDNETNHTNYKLIINHNPSDFNNPIIDLLGLFYYEIVDINELKDDADKKLFQEFNYYKNYI